MVRPSDKTSGGVLERQHPHKVVVVKWALSSLIPMIVAVCAVAFQSMQSLVERLAALTGLQNIGSIILVVALLAVAVFVILLGCYYLSYRNFWWEVADDELHVYRGVISKHQAHISFHRIHSIDMDAKVLDRILGIVTLKVQTAGSSAPEAVLSGLSLADAERLRSYIFARKDANVATPGQPVPGMAASGTAGTATAVEAPGKPMTGSVPSASAARAMDANQQVGEVSDAFRGAFGGTSATQQPPDYEYRLSMKEVILAAITGRGVAIAFFGMIVAIISGVTSLPFADAIVEGATKAGSAASGAFGASFAIVVVLFVLGCFLLLWALAVVASVLNYGGFVVRRRGDRVETEYGLLQHHFNGVTLERMQSVTVKRGWLRRLFGYASVIVSTVSDGGGDSSDNQGVNSQGVVVHPFIRYADVDAFLTAALPGFDYGEVAYQRLPPIARRRALNRFSLIPLAIIAVVLIAAAIFFGTVGYVAMQVATVVCLVAVVVILLALGIPAAFLWYSHAGYSWNDRMVFLQHGAFTIEETRIPRRRVQWVRSKENPFQRLRGLATISVATAAGGSAARNTLRDVPASRAVDLLDWACPRPQGDVADEPLAQAVEMVY